MFIQILPTSLFVLLLLLLLVCVRSEVLLLKCSSGFSYSTRLHFISERFFQKNCEIGSLGMRQRKKENNNNNNNNNRNFVCVFECTIVNKFTNAA